MNGNNSTSPGFHPDKLDKGVIPKISRSAFREGGKNVILSSCSQKSSYQFKISLVIQWLVIRWKNQNSHARRQLVSQENRQGMWRLLNRVFIQISSELFFIIRFALFSMCEWRRKNSQSSQQEAPTRMYIPLCLCKLKFLFLLFWIIFSCTEKNNVRTHKSRIKL